MMYHVKLGSFILYLGLLCKIGEMISQFETLLFFYILISTFRNTALSKDYYVFPETSEAMIQVAMIRIMLKRLAT